jgi:hypothetical protein
MAGELHDLQWPDVPPAHLLQLSCFFNRFYRFPHGEIKRVGQQFLCDAMDKVVYVLPGNRTCMESTQRRTLARMFSRMQVPLCCQLLAAVSRHEGNFSTDNCQNVLKHSSQCLSVYHSRKSDEELALAIDFSPFPERTVHDPLGRFNDCEESTTLTHAKNRANRPMDECSCKIRSLDAFFRGNETLLTI